MTGGQTSFLGFNPAREIGLFILSNQAPTYMELEGAPPTAADMQFLDNVALEIFTHL